MRSDLIQIMASVISFIVNTKFWLWTRLKTNDIVNHADQGQHQAVSVNTRPIHIELFNLAYVYVRTTFEQRCLGQD